LKVLIHTIYFSYKKVGVILITHSWHSVRVAGVNDSVDHAAELAELLHGSGSGYHVNLIPFNPIEDSEYKRPSKKAV